MEVRAVTKFTGISPQKTRLVLDEVRGRQAEEALALLAFMPQQSAKVVAKTIKSALANATVTGPRRDLQLAVVTAPPSRSLSKFRCRDARHV